LARTLQLTGDRSEAHTMYVRVLKLLPDYAPAHYSLGMLYLEVGDHVRANHQFAQTLKYDPYHSQARLFLDYTEKAKSPNNNNHP
jgi:tetratricopeptide (TPR) repeat protein